ncbi:MAG: type II toxin-antitoxin system HicB family antitoxin [Gemmatimonadota bacterium]
MRRKLLINQDEDGVYVAEVPSLPGCVSQGSTHAEALTNTCEAIALYLESLEEHGDPRRRARLGGVTRTRKGRH